MGMSPTFFWTLAPITASGQGLSPITFSPSIFSPNRLSPNLQPLGGSHTNFSFGFFPRATILSPVSARVSRLKKKSLWSRTNPRPNAIISLSRITSLRFQFSFPFGFVIQSGLVTETAPNYIREKWVKFFMNLSRFSFNMYVVCNVYIKIFVNFSNI